MTMNMKLIIGVALLCAIIFGVIVFMRKRNNSSVESFEQNENMSDNDNIANDNVDDDDDDDNNDDDDDDDDDSVDDNVDGDD